MTAAISASMTIAPRHNGISLPPADPVVLSVTVLPVEYVPSGLVVSCLIIGPAMSHAASWAGELLSVVARFFRYSRVELDVPAWAGSHSRGFGGCECAADVATSNWRCC